MFNKIRELFDILSTPLTNWVQIEISTLCPASCTYCPHTVLKQNWRDENMTLETFKKILPALSRTQLAYLQGWGEPFCHPHIFEMIRLAKRRGCKVGTSTNGTLLDQNRLDRLLEEKLDLIAFSLAGCGDFNDRVRRGTHIDQILRHIDYLKTEKEKRGINYPEIHIAYLLLKSGMPELDQLPALLKDRGVAQVVISTLDFVPSAEIADEIVAPATAGEYDALTARLETVAVELARSGIRLHYHLRHPDRPPGGCTENIQRSFFVAADGSVSPCVFRSLPVEETRSSGPDKTGGYHRLVFGNVNRETPARIWKSKNYRQFREAFTSGETDVVCRACPKLYMD